MTDGGLLSALPWRPGKPCQYCTSEFWEVTSDKPAEIHGRPELLPGPTLGLRGGGFPFSKSSEEENPWGWDAGKRTPGSFSALVSSPTCSTSASFCLAEQVEPLGPFLGAVLTGSACRPEMRLAVSSRGFLRGSPPWPTLSSRLTHLFEGLLRARNF